MIRGCWANNESLPFADEQFDCYISNLSLHIVTNPINQLKEALRVTKPGTRFGFSVWGRRDNFNFDKVTDELLKKYGAIPSDSPVNPMYKIGGKDEESAQKMLAE